MQSASESVSGEMIDLGEGKGGQDIGVLAKANAKQLHMAAFKTILDGNTLLNIDKSYMFPVMGSELKNTGILAPTLDYALGLTEKDLLQMSEEHLIQIAKLFNDPMLNAHIARMEDVLAGLAKQNSFTTKKDFVFFLKSTIDFENRLPLENDAKKTALENVSRIDPLALSSPQQTYLPIAPMPTDLCRISPFFPMSKIEKSKRPFIEDMVIAQSSWGEILYNGPKLSTEDEDVLMSIISVLNNPARRHFTEVQGKTTYCYKGPLRPVVANMGKEDRGGKEYKRVMASLKLMMSGVVELRVRKRIKAKGETRGGSKIDIFDLSNLVSHAKWDQTNKLLEFTINPYFYEAFIGGTVTRIDVIKRASLSSPVAKLLYRFIQSHRDDVWEGHYITLAHSLNLDVDQQAKELRRLLKDAIKRNIEKNIMRADSGFLKNSPDIVVLHRSSDLQRKTLPKP